MISLIGSGNVATWIAQRLASSENFPITQVFSRNIENAKTLAQVIDAEAIDNLQLLNRNNKIFIFALSDNAFPDILKSIHFRMPAAFLTSGTVSCKCLADFADNYGVIYPLQTFTKSQNMTETKVPLCIESTHAQGVKDELLQLAKELSPNFREISEEERAILHIAAVFACNFSNAMFNVAYNILTDNNIPFKMLIPLIENTIEKLKYLTPKEAQTGPAVRHDTNVMEKHISSLNDEKLQLLYKEISELIEDFSKK